ncbi:MAG: tRNA glutamyl-Q(34) synthetase GluQRS [Methylococcales bacterium]|nr:tRNA glutamyl-Q(34) synthetase GluQRS [Methylococcales bacterium]
MHRLQNPGRNSGKATGVGQSATARYIGRFAPSPTGPLHLGSLYTALASFLDARSRQGLWLLRIDDLDAPRNQPGAEQAILDCLKAYGLQWDGEIYYQSRHLTDYEAAINRLQQHVYGCVCSRKELAAYPDVYPGFCRHLPRPQIAHALRIKTCNTVTGFTDAVQGEIRRNVALQDGDFIIKRKDGVIAYQLAVVVDDHAQQVNQVVRGYDLLDATPKQIFLQTLLGYPQPAYMHVPVIVDRHGNKLSKQTCAQAVDLHQAATTLHLLLFLLKQNPPPALRTAGVADILDWAIAHWRPGQLVGCPGMESPPDRQSKMSLSTDSKITEK